MLPLFTISLLAFVTFGIAPRKSSIASICGQLDLYALVQLAQLQLILQSPWRLAVDWIVMIVAMMMPLVSPQVAHVWRSSLPARRYPATIVMLAGYLSCWLLAGALILPIVVFLSIILPGQLSALAAVVVFASIWSASPWAQRARNRCHAVSRIRPFGANAYIDSARLGISTGRACVVSCWPWMLAPLVVETGHVLAMAAIAIYLFAERIAPTARPSWNRPPAWETLFGPLGLEGPPKRDGHEGCIFDM
jgi:predicted metal-binding membrane protein